MRDALALRPLDRTAVLGLILMFALIGAPHVLHLSPLLLLVFYLALIWRAAAVWMPRLLPGGVVKVLLTLSAAGAVAFSAAGELDGRTLGVGLLTVMAGLKTLELVARRDLYVTVFLGCFLLATQFLFDRSLWLTLYLVPWLLGLLSLLAYNNRVQPPDWKVAVRDTAKLFVAGLPMAVVLFVLFPRLAGPLWAVHAPAKGVTGMTDQLSPGSLAELVQSQATAFRVTFDGAPPAAAARYWRGPVFWDTNGRTWSAAEPSGLRRDPPQVTTRWSQEVTLEPSNQNWLFAVDRALSAPPNAVLSRDGQLLMETAVNQRLNYQVVSSPAAGETRLSPQERDRALAFPPGLVTQRMRDLVQGWQGGGATGAQVVQAALAHYREAPFVYTLRPPQLSDNVVDGFLFETQRGFCEHYATSFAVLMRLAGIPTRVVGGYQGGEWNPRGEHLLVRQSDAHAWAEVWLGDGWVRVDPTAAVAPERIERSIDTTVAQAGEAATFQAPAPGWVSALWREGSWFIDGLELGWQRWIVGYSDRSQADLLSRLGLQGISGYTLALTAVVAAGLTLLPLWWWLRRQGHDRSDAVLRAYRRLQQKLAKAGLPFPDSGTPSDLGRQAAKRFPDQGVAIRQIVALYQVERYGASPSQKRRRQLIRAVGNLRLPRSR